MTLHYIHTYLPTYITLHYITLRYITLHLHLHLHYITLNYIHTYACVSFISVFACVYLVVPICLLKIDSFLLTYHPRTVNSQRLADFR